MGFRDILFEVCCVWYELSVLLDLIPLSFFWEGSNWYFLWNLNSFLGCPPREHFGEVYMLMRSLEDVSLYDTPGSVSVFWLSFTP